MSFNHMDTSHLPLGRFVEVGQESLGTVQLSQFSTTTFYAPGPSVPAPSSSHAPRGPVGGLQDWTTSGFSSPHPPSWSNTVPTPSFGHSAHTPGFNASPGSTVNTTPSPFAMPSHLASSNTHHSPANRFSGSAGSSPAPFHSHGTSWNPHVSNTAGAPAHHSSAPAGFSYGATANPYGSGGGGGGGSAVGQW
eukprot:TRINITY_DN11812_c0_g1_i1.p2 TRINITY_DN11812_c0_g1~~TRINITY_DN11812_c0_g1_i1.p2  ORF type:complete len:199 (-),score=29.10 TRINITY_DN11812_c0_g1_i1:34-609(-)